MSFQFQLSLEASQALQAMIPLTRISSTNGENDWVLQLRPSVYASPLGRISAGAIPRVLQVFDTAQQLTVELDVQQLEEHIKESQQAYQQLLSLARCTMAGLQLDHLEKHYIVFSAEDLRLVEQVVFHIIYEDDHITLAIDTTSTKHVTLAQVELVAHYLEDYLGTPDMEATS